MKRSNKHGFTLIELLVVMALLAILIVAGLASYTTSLKKGRDTKRKNDLREISIALETYYNDKGQYPLSLNGEIVGCGAGAATLACSWGSEWNDTTSGTIYMLALGADPVAADNYYYVSDAKGTYFQLYALLENTKDTGNGIDQSGYVNTDCSSGTPCTYGIASSNKTP